MNICIVMSNPFPPEEGIGNYVYNLSRKFIEKEHQITIITRGSLNKNQTEVIDGIKILKPRFIPFYPFHVHIHGLYVNKLFNSISREFDILHIHTPLSPFIKTSLPVITTVHTPMLTDTRYIESGGLKSLTVKFMGKYISYPLELKLLKRAEIITSVSTSVAQELKEYGVDPHEVKVIGNGVDEKVFIPVQNKNKERFILFTGRLGHRKGLFDLIECGKYIQKDYPDVSFIIVGKGPLSGKMQQRVKELNLQSTFKFLGYVSKEKLIQLYHDATLYVMPSHYEGLPTVLLEAMSCGLPVVATAVSGNLDVVSSGKNGILIPPKSPRKMADAISRLLGDDEMRKGLGNNARKTIEEHYTWDAISNKILKCYDSLVGV